MQLAPLLLSAVLRPIVCHCATSWSLMPDSQRTPCIEQTKQASCFFQLKWRFREGSKSWFDYMIQIEITHHNCHCH